MIVDYKEIHKLPKKTWEKAIVEYIMKKTNNNDEKFNPFLSRTLKSWAKEYGEKDELYLVLLKIAKSYV